MLKKITFLFIIIVFSCSSGYIGRISHSETINTENSLYLNYIPIYSNSYQIKKQDISAKIKDSLLPILDSKGIDILVKVDEFSNEKKFNKTIKQELSIIKKTKSLDFSPSIDFETILQQKNKRYAIIVASNPSLEMIKKSKIINDTIHRYVKINYALECLVYDLKKRKYIYYNQTKESKSNISSLNKILRDLLDF